MKTVPKNIGKKIRSLPQIRKAIADRRALICPGSYCFDRPIPAAVIINMSGTTILGLINKGLHLYKKAKQ